MPLSALILGGSFPRFPSTCFSGRCWGQSTSNYSNSSQQRHGGQQRLLSDERCRDGVQRCKEAYLQVGGGSEHSKQRHQDPADDADDGSKLEQVRQWTSASSFLYIISPLWFTRSPVEGVPPFVPRPSTGY